MTEYRLVAEPRVDLDVAATHQRYENEPPGLGLEFLDQLRATYDRIAAAPSSIGTFGPESAAHCFGASPYFAVEGNLVVVLAVLHVSRRPAEWRRQRS